MPTILGRRRAKRSPGRSSPLYRLLATREVVDRPQWLAVYGDVLASSHLPLLAHWREEAFCTPAERRTIEEALIANTARNQLFLQVAGTVIAELAQAGIDVRLLKGIATVQDCYVEVGERQLGDIDLLVPKARLAEAAATLVNLGYEPLQPDLVRASLDDPHLLASGVPAADHHHWPPLVGPTGVVVELHWTLGDGFAGAVDRLWVADTPLPAGRALAWADRLYHALLAVARSDDPRAVADAAGLVWQWPTRGVTALLERAQEPTVARQLAIGLARLADLGCAEAAALRQALALPAADDEPVRPTPWRRRLQRLRSATHWRVFLRMGWGAWRFPGRLARLPLPAVAAALASRPFARGRVACADVVAYAGYWSRQRWLPRPSYCLQRSALLFAGLTAIGEDVALTFGLDPGHPTPVGHAWVERNGLPFLEDPALIERMVPTYRYPSP